MAFGKPRITVAAVLERDGRFLLVEESVGDNLVVNQPAGHLENGESVLAAVRRETLEETAWEFDPEWVLGIYLWQPAPDADAYLRIAFTGRLGRHDPDRILDAGISRAVWLERNEIESFVSPPRSPLVLRNIDDYLAGRRFPLDMLNHLPTGESA